ncbi:hypothetical protein D3C78_1369410 [compost metagenome]
MLHQLADQAQPMGASNGANSAAQEWVGLVMGLGERLDIQATLGEVGGVMGCADDRDLFFPQPLLGCAIQMVEMAFLTVGDQAMGDRIEVCRCRGRKRHQWITLCGTKQAKRRQRALASEHRVDEHAIRAEFKNERGVTDLLDVHEAFLLSERFMVPTRSGVHNGRI